MASVARTLFLRCLLLAAVVPCAQLEASSPAEPPAGLPAGPRLLWSDPETLMPIGLDQLADELAVIGRAMGAEIRLDLPGRGDEPDEHRYRVSVMRAPKAYWRLRDDVMAAAPRAEGSQGTIYVFLEQVRSVLGHLADRNPSQAPREHAELATALARILAHELVHLVAPDHPHATSGLMVANLRRSSLLKRRARIDPACAQAFRRALGAEGHAAAPVLTTRR
jgi:plasmid stabilization system protein ParE